MFSNQTRFLFLWLSVYLKVKSQTGGVSCYDWEYADAGSKTSTLAYCDKTGTATTLEGQLRCQVDILSFELGDYRVTCTCNTGYTLPNCSLKLPTLPLEEFQNNVKNTCFLEDLLVINQWKNEETVDSFFAPEIVSLTLRNEGQ
eukprot:GHVP01011136.1.p1 GENE.GHVP01011136.1~~GHVP01011136.1.p1  ORF type:complete len:144 (+),score=6.00 GHVP01011136.1:395-826(+)